MIPSLRLDLQLKTPLASQELTSSSSAGLSYWEGAIDISGTRRPVRRSAGLAIWR